MLLLFFSWYCAMYVVYLSSSIMIRTWIYIYTFLSNHHTRTVSHHVRHDEWHILTTLILRKCGGVKFDGWTTQTCCVCYLLCCGFHCCHVGIFPTLIYQYFFSSLKKESYHTDAFFTYLL